MTHKTARDQSHRFVLTKRKKGKEENTIKLVMAQEAFAYAKRATIPYSPPLQCLHYALFFYL
jgi:hypothetical protein